MHGHCRWPKIGQDLKRSDGTAKAPGATGRATPHTIHAGGRFDLIAGPFLAGTRPQWQSRPTGGDATAAKKKASKTKFTCPSCGQNAWAKPDAALMCVPCEEIMLAEDLSKRQGDDEQGPN